MSDDSSDTTSRRRFLTATAAVGGSALLGTRYAGTAAGGGAGRSRSSGRTDIDGDTLVTDWKAPTPNYGSKASPVVAEVDTDAYTGGVVYDAPVDVGVRAYALEDGTPLWETELEGLVGEGPTVEDGVAYVATDGETYALDAATGSVLWSYEMGGSLGIAVGEDHVYAPTGRSAMQGSTDYTPEAVERTLRAFEKADGTVAWERSFGGTDTTAPDEFKTQPVLVDGELVVGGAMGLVGVDPASGETNWQQFDYVDSMTVADGVAYCVTGDEQTLTAFDLASKERQWTADVKGSDPLYHDGAVFVAQQAFGTAFDAELQEDGVSAVDAGTGEVRWQRNTWAEATVPGDFALVPTTPPTVANGQVVVGAANTSGPTSEHAAIFGLDPESGDVETHWWAPISEDMDAEGAFLSRWLGGAPTAVDGHLLVSSYDPTGYAPRTQGLYALAWSDSPPGEGPAEPSPVQTGGCSVEDGQTSVGVQPYPDQDDGYGQGYAYVWDVMDDGVFDDTGTRDGMVPLPDDATGTVTTTVTVRDRFGRTATGSLDITVEAACASFTLTVSPKTALTDEEFTGQLEVRNADASEFDYHWAVADQYEPEGDTSWTTSLSAPGTYTLSVRVTSDAGFDQTFETDVTVQCPDDA
ncbi:PQQ-binding-like beta-propeller repeat protein [Halorubellus litoreus]|uniref:PQQ-binding-like beta-propeller repeat protein n=1 Tax=Halorubellus litoreus TaxID=755308 RepID=A0ABD5VC48_9EURY